MQSGNPAEQKHSPGGHQTGSQGRQGEAEVEVNVVGESGWVVSSSKVPIWLSQFLR